MKVSDCCGVPAYSNGDSDTEDIGICPECKEHCEYVDDEEIESVSPEDILDMHVRTTKEGFSLKQANSGLYAQIISAMREYASRMVLEYEESETPSTDNGWIEQAREFFVDNHLKMTGVFAGNYMDEEDFEKFITTFCPPIKQALGLFIFRWIVV